MQIGITGATGTVLTHRLDKCNLIAVLEVICSKDDIGVWINENEFSTIIHLAAMVPTHKVKYNPLIIHPSLLYLVLIDTIFRGSNFYRNTSLVFRNNRYS